MKIKKIVCILIAVMLCGCAQGTAPTGSLAQSSSNLQTTSSSSQSVPKPQSGKTIEIWASAQLKNYDSVYQNIFKYLDKKTGNFKANITYMPTYSPMGEEDKRLFAKLMAGEGPDLFLMSAVNLNGSPTHWFANIEDTAQNGMFMDLEPYFSKNEDLTADNFIDSVMQAGVIDGKRYLAPIQYSTKSYYSKDNFEFLGEGGVDNAEKDIYSFFNSMISAKDSYVILSGEGNIPLSSRLSVSLWAQPEIIDYKNDKVTLSKDSFLKAAELQRQYFTQKSTGGLLYTGNGAAYTQNIDGLSAELVQTKDFNVNTKILTVPNQNGKTTPMVESFAAIYNGSENADMAMELISFLLSENVQNGTLLEDEDGEPVTKDVRMNDTLSSLQFLSMGARPVRLGCENIPQYENIISRLNKARFYNVYLMELDAKLLKLFQDERDSGIKADLNKFYEEIVKDIEFKLAE